MRNYGEKNIESGNFDFFYFRKYEDYLQISYNCTEV